MRRLITKFINRSFVSTLLMLVAFFILSLVKPDLAEYIRTESYSSVKSVIGDIRMGRFYPFDGPLINGDTESDEQSVSSLSPSSEDIFYAGAPSYKGKSVILENDSYIVGYDPSRGGAVWSAYRLFPVSDLSSPPRDDWFKADFRLESPIIEHAYINSGYDRGHLAPNYGIATRYGSDAQKSTFLMSNILPQKPALNREIWRDAEMYIASHVAQKSDTWVIVGPVYDDDIEWLNDSKTQRVEIPDAFFMIATVDNGGRPEGFAILIDQNMSKGTDFRSYCVTIDEIEERTGLDFFTNLFHIFEINYESDLGDL